MCIGGFSFSFEVVKGNSKMWNYINTRRPPHPVGAVPDCLRESESVFDSVSSRSNRYDS